MMSQPLAPWRHVKVRERRTSVDFAHCLRDSSDGHFPHAEKIIQVMDNLNTDSLASLYAAFEAQQVRRLCERFEIHYTPNIAHA